MRHGGDRLLEHRDELGERAEYGLEAVSRRPDDRFADRDLGQPCSRPAPAQKELFTIRQFN
jgi:hypothetical protein